MNKETPTLLQPESVGFTLSEDCVDMLTHTFTPEQIQLRNQRYGVDNIDQNSGFHREELRTLYLIDSATDYLSKINREELWKALRINISIFSLKQRKDHVTPYSSHFLSMILEEATHGLDGTTLVATACHDVVEDFGYLSPMDIASYFAAPYANTAEAILQTFGTEVAETVFALTKEPSEELSKEAVDERLVVKILRRSFESLKSVGNVQYTETNIRAVVIKLFDRLNSMRTLGQLPRVEDQIRNAKDTLPLIQIAKRLGLWDIANELHEIALLYLKDAPPTAETKFIHQQAKTQRKMAKDYHRNTFQDMVEGKLVDKSEQEQMEIVKSLVPGLNRLTHQDHICVSTPGAGAIVQHGEAFLNINIGLHGGIDSKRFLGRLADIYNDIDLYLQEKNKPWIQSPSPLSVQKILWDTDFIDTFTCEIPIELPGITLLRINIMPERILQYESIPVTDILLERPRPYHSHRAYERSLQYKIARAKIQHIRRQYLDLSTMGGSNPSAPKILYALAKHIPYDMDVIIGIPPKNGKERPSIPTLVPKDTTILKFAATHIKGAQSKTIEWVRVNRDIIPPEFYDMDLPPYATITIKFKE